MKIDDFVLENWLNPACDSEKTAFIWAEAVCLRLQ